MSKRVNLSNEKPPAKRARGFRLARSNPEAAISPNPSLFVTVETDHQQRGTLAADTRVITRSSAAGATPEPEEESRNEPQNDDSSGLMEDMESTVHGDTNPQAKPKRKRNTTNVV